MFMPLPDQEFLHLNSIAVNQADILIVIDNSLSTQTFHDNIDNRMSNLISQLSGIEYRIAVTTNSVFCNGGRYLFPFPAVYNNGPGPGDTVYPANCAFDPVYNLSNTPNFYNVIGSLQWYGRYIQDGLLMPLSGAPGYWVTPATPSPQLVVGNTIQDTGVDGSWSEQSIKAVYRAVERSQFLDINAYNLNNVSFFRDSASFIVIMVTSGAESGVLPENQATTLFSYVKSVWPKKNFHYHSIYDASIDQNMPCDSSRGFTETCSKGQYTAITNQTGGLFGNVNSVDYGPVLTSMGAQIKSASKNVPLNCPPTSGVTVTGPGPVPAFSVVGSTIVFATNFKVGGTYDFQYYCNVP